MSTMLTVPSGCSKSGTGVGIAVGCRATSVASGVPMGIAVGSRSSTISVGVRVGARVLVGLGVPVAVAVGTAVGVFVAVPVGAAVSVAVGSAVRVGVGVGLGVPVGVAGGVSVSVGLVVLVGRAVALANGADTAAGGSSVSGIKSTQPADSKSRTASEIATNGHPMPRLLDTRCCIGLGLLIAHAAIDFGSHTGSQSHDLPATQICGRSSF